MDQQLPEFTMAEELVRVTREVPGVVDVYGGPLGAIATYGRGGRVPGIRIRTEEGRLSVEMHIIAAYAADLKLPALADKVRKRIRQQLHKLDVGNIGQIDVVVDDIEIDSAPQDTRAT
jgi:uncharacterized alkaline shock family protein YloU